MSRNCQCCNREIKGDICGYCEYLNAVNLDGKMLEQERKRLNDHRSAIVGRLKGFSVEAYNYIWNPAKSTLEPKGRERVVIADGKQILNTIVWSRQQFGKNPDEKASKRQLVISYQVKDVSKKLEVTLETIQCSGFWKIGIKMHDDFTLSVYLGNEQEYTVSGPYHLEIK